MPETPPVAWGSYRGRVTTDTVRVGGRQVLMAKAEDWVRRYFDAVANTNSRQPYAYPAYDMLACGSSSSELNDGDLLAPTLLNAAPKIAAFYALQSAREQLEAGLRTAPEGVTLATGGRLES